MTLLSICNDVCDEVGILRPSTIVSNTSDDARKLLRLANKVGTRLMKAFPWQVLRGEKTFTAVSGSEQASILPDDFDRFVPETFWNRSGSKLITGPINPIEWQTIKALSTDVVEYKFIYRGGSIYVTPNMAGGETLAFEYVKKNWCQSSGGTAQDAWAADDDTGIIDEELMTLGIIFEFLDSDGQPAQRAAAQYLEYFNQLTDNELPAARTMLSADIFGGQRRTTGAPGVQSTLIGLW